MHGTMNYSGWHWRSFPARYFLLAKAFKLEGSEQRQSGSVLIAVMPDQYHETHTGVATTPRWKKLLAK